MLCGIRAGHGPPASSTSHTDLLMTLSPDMQDVLLFLPWALQ